MPKKKLFIGANWKMNQAPLLWDASDSPYRSNGNPDVVVFPSSLDLHSCIQEKFAVGGQYGRPEAAGAFTGDIAMKELRKVGCTHVLCGHSERRRHHEESDAFVAKQVESALQCGLTPVLCIGENADQREMDETKEVLAEQLLRCVAMKDMIVAYEPVWAIGTGRTPTQKEVDETHKFIRSLLKDKSTRIIYGGSVTGENAAGFFAEEEIDGALVGGASLKLEEFRKIVTAAKR